jgi:hypothetical protein
MGFFRFIAMPMVQEWCKAFPECNALMQKVSTLRSHDLKAMLVEETWRSHANCGTVIS